MKSVFINPERCIGCRQCEFACAVAHSVSKDPATALTEDPLPRSRIHVSPGLSMNSSFPTRCRHCNPAPCEQVCPTGAIARDEALDVVALDIHKCIACAMCAMVCPFDAVTFHTQANGMPPRVVATKCDGCADRVRQGLEAGLQRSLQGRCAGLRRTQRSDREPGRLRVSSAVLTASASREADIPQTCPRQRLARLGRSGGQRQPGDMTWRPPTTFAN